MTDEIHVVLGHYETNRFTDRLGWSSGRLTLSAPSPPAVVAHQILECGACGEPLRIRLYNRRGLRADRLVSAGVAVVAAAAAVAALYWLVDAVSHSDAYATRSSFFAPAASLTCTAALAAVAARRARTVTRSSLSMPREWLVSHGFRHRLRQE